MKGLRKYLSPFAPDQSGAAAVLCEFHGLIIILDAGGCAGNICGFDEPRWFESRSAIFSAGLRDMDALSQASPLPERSHPEEMPEAPRLFRTFPHAFLKFFPNLREEPEVPEDRSVLLHPPDSTHRHSEAHESTALPH